MFIHRYALEELSRALEIAVAAASGLYQSEHQHVTAIAATALLQQQQQQEDTASMTRAQSLLQSFTGQQQLQQTSMPDHARSGGIPAAGAALAGVAAGHKPGQHKQHVSKQQYHHRHHQQQQGLAEGMSTGVSTASGSGSVDPAKLASAGRTSSGDVTVIIPPQTPAAALNASEAGAAGAAAGDPAASTLGGQNSQSAASVAAGGGGDRFGGPGTTRQDQQEQQHRKQQQREQEKEVAAGVDGEGERGSKVTKVSPQQQLQQIMLLLVPVQVSLQRDTFLTWKRGQLAIAPVSGTRNW